MTDGTNNGSRGWCGTGSDTFFEEQSVNGWKDVFEKQKNNWNIEEHRSCNEPVEDTFRSKKNWKLPMDDFLKLVENSYNDRPDNEGKLKMLENMLPFLDTSNHSNTWTYFSNVDVAKKLFTLLGIDENTMTKYLSNIVRKKYYRLNGEVILICEENRKLKRIYPDGYGCEIIDRWGDGEVCNIMINSESGCKSMMYNQCLKGSDIEIINGNIKINFLS
jgi:hypothetical protein